MKPTSWRTADVDTHGPGALHAIIEREAEDSREFVRRVVRNHAAGAS